MNSKLPQHYVSRLVPNPGSGKPRSLILPPASPADATLLYLIFQDRKSLSSIYEQVVDFLTIFVKITRGRVLSKNICPNQNEEKRRAVFDPPHYID